MRISNTGKTKTHLLVAIYILIVLVGASCTSVKFISDYDEQTDIQITAFQKSMESHLTKMERHVGEDVSKYENNVEFYEDAFVQLRTVLVRARALKKNDIITQQVELLIASLENLEKIHKLGLSENDIPPLRSAFSSSTTAILRLLLALKRGE